MRFTHRPATSTRFVAGSRYSSPDRLSSATRVADTVPMGLSQIRPPSDGSRDEMRAYRIVPEGDRSSTVFDLSDGRTPLALSFLSTEPAAFAGKLREKGVDAA